MSMMLWFRSHVFGAISGPRAIVVSDERFEELMQIADETFDAVEE